MPNTGVKVEAMVQKLSVLVLALALVFVRPAIMTYADSDDRPPVSPIDWLLVPGERIGPFEIGMSMDEARELGHELAKQYGLKYEEDVDGSGFIVSGDRLDQPLFAAWDTAIGPNSLSTPGVLYEALVINVPVHQENGIKFGSSVNDVLVAWGAPDEAYYGGYLGVWTTLGILAFLGNDGQIIGLGVTTVR